MIVELAMRIEGIKGIMPVATRSFKGLFQRKRESDSGVPDAPSITGGESHGAHLSSSTSFFHRGDDLHPVSYAGNLDDLPERPNGFNRVLQQIRARPAMKKPQQQQQQQNQQAQQQQQQQQQLQQNDRVGSGAQLPVDRGDKQRGAVQASRTKSDGSDTEANNGGGGGGLPTINASIGGSGSSVSGGKDEAGRGNNKRPSTGLRGAKDDDRGPLDDSELLGREFESQLSQTPNYGSDMDEVDSSATPDPARTKALMDHYLFKVERTKELIKAEQKTKDDNVMEYLAVAENADKAQISRIKNVFEKKNLRTNTNIANLQKKLENYQRRLSEIVNSGAAGPRKPKEVLQGMHQGLKGVRDNIREGITGFSGAMVAKPKEFASKFKNKFGSADNLDSINDDDDQNSVNQKSKSSWFTPMPAEALPKSLSDGEETYSLTSGSGQNGHPLLGDDDVEHPLAGAVNKLQRTVQELTASQSRLQQNIEDLQNQLQHQLQYYSQSFQEERYRAERLEEQLTDLTDLHTHAMSNLQQELGSVQERLEYRMEERSRDYIESVEQCQTRISKIELAQQHQQVITLEGYENANARALLSKLINVILLVLAVILVIFSNAINLVSPLVQTKSRLLVTILIGVSLFYLWQQREMIEGARHNFPHNLLHYLPFSSR